MADPLWLLTRQWQFGEFQGEDTGSPISARLRGEVAQLTRYWPGPVLTLPNNAPLQGKKFDPRQQPLEPLVERESVRLIPPAQAQKLDLRADAGLHFLRLIARAVGPKYRDLFCQKFPLPALPEDAVNADEESLRLAQMLTTRVPDGAKLFTASMSGTLLDDPTLNQDRATLQPVVEAWAKWYGQLFSEPEGERSAWQPERQEYAFAVAAPRSDNVGETVLTAREYYEGSLEWHSFDLRPSVSLSANTDRVAGQNPAPLVQTLMPAPVTFRGMPAQRFWEFEDATVDLGAIETKPEDLARMLLIEFALSYGNDWFVLPIELSVGSLCQISSLVITDTFGERTLIPAPNASLLPAASAWRMYRNSADRGAATGFSTAAPPEFFFLAPTLGKTLEGQPLEEVLFVRDEMANLAWGIERTVEGASGRPVNQREAYLARLQKRPPGVPLTIPAAADGSPTLTYRLATEVPDYWIPLMPVPLNPQTGAMQLVRRANARSRILSGLQNVLEEEVPREGIRVTRTFQLARWLDGSTHLWVGRYKETGRGEASSGLQFDLAEKVEESA